jgi:hypothetical protein
MTDSAGKRRAVHGNIDPATRAALTSASKALVNNVSAAQLVGAQWSNQYANLFKQLATVRVPRVEIPQIKLPPLILDYNALFPDMSKILAGVSAQLTPALEAVRQIQRSQFADVLRQFNRVADMVRASMPPNWRDATSPNWAELETMTLDEGLALGWVPESEVLHLLFSAPDAAARRRIIGRRWQRIVRHCMSELDAIDTKSLVRHARFGKEAADALLKGSAAPSQALSANLLDTILRAHFTDTDRRRLVGQRRRLSVDAFSLRRAIVLGGIWGAFGEYWPTQGDPIPTKFSRHASAHAVTRRQFSRLNATIALMHVTSLLRLLDAEMAKPKR